MNEILFGSVMISLLHALLPNHWLPLVAIGKKQGWSLARLSAITLMVGMAHAGSTILIGVALAAFGWRLSGAWMHWAAPVLLVGLGIWFMYRHHHHHHFHLSQSEESILSVRAVVWALTLAMFFSPCLEIEAYFLLAGAQGWSNVLLLGALYLGISVAGMLVWVRLMFHGMQRFDWHLLEHNAGLITGATLIGTGIFSFFVH